MKPKDAQYYDEMIQLVKGFNYLNVEEEKKFLLKHNAMKDGIVISEYPKLFYIISGEKRSHDEGGNIMGLKVKQEQLEKEGKNAWIDYVPRFYSFYIMAKTKIENDRVLKEKINKE